MEKYLDFEDEKHEKGYKPLPIGADSFRANIGRPICYVDYVEPYRGTYFVRYGIIHAVKRNIVMLDDGDRVVEIRKIKECGIKIET